MLTNIGLPGLALILVIFLLFFGRGRISSLMGDMGQGLSILRRGPGDDEDGPHIA